MLRHHAGGLVHRGARRDRHQRPADEVAHPGLEDCATGGRQLQRGDGAAHPAGPLGVEEGVDLGMVRAQPVEVGCGQEQRQGVLDRRDVEGRRVAVGQAGRTEARALAPAVDEGPLRVADLGGTRPQHVEVEVVATSFDQSGPAAEVLDGHPRGKGVEHGVREHVERLVAREEATRLGELGVEGHAPIVAAPARCGRVGWSHTPGERPGRPSGPASLDERRICAGRKPPTGPPGCWNEASRRRGWRPRGRWGAMSDSTIEPLPDGDGKLGNAEGPADSGAGQSGMPGEHDGGADGGAAGGAEGPADSGAGESRSPASTTVGPTAGPRARPTAARARPRSPVSTTVEPTAGPTPRSDDSSPGAARGPLLPGGGPRVVHPGRGRPRHLRAGVLGPRTPADPKPPTARTTRRSSARTPSTSCSRDVRCARRSCGWRVTARRSTPRPSPWAGAWAPPSATR